VTQPLLLLDSASLYFRAFFGMKDSVKAADGTPVNAVRGFLDFIARLVNDHNPAELVCCWDDDWRPEFRVAAIPSYKAHRVAVNTADGEDVPDELDVQVPLIIDVLTALGIARIGAAGYEADDVIGTLATRADRPVLIVTGDRDLFQLVDDSRDVRVLYTAKGGVANGDIVTEAYISEKYAIPGRAYADFSTLRGDTSDGLPGVPGVGEKTAATLISLYGDLAGVRDAAERNDAATRATIHAKVLAAADYLDVAPTVVRVALDVPIASDSFEIPQEPADRAALTYLADQWNIRSSIGRVMQAMKMPAL